MDLTERIRSKLGEFPGAFAVYAHHLGTGAVVDIDADRVLPTRARPRRSSSSPTASSSQRVSATLTRGSSSPRTSDSPAPACCVTSTRACT